MKRRTAREIAVQSLYHMEMNDVSADKAIKMVIEEGNDDDPHTSIPTDSIQSEFMQKIVEGTWQNKADIDELLTGYLKGWKMDRLSRVDLQILRLAVFEMFYDTDSPPKVIVNEAIDLSKHFGAEESGKFVNGVMGKMIKEMDEIKAGLAAKNSVEEESK
jgi:N utilization substance protein B